MIKGFVTGSFRPFHKGHMALIDYAKANCDKLTILVTTLPDEIISYKHRLSWVLSTYLDDPKVDVVNAIIKEPDLPYDELSRWWGFSVRTHYGEFDRVFTSEEYGKVFSETIGAENWVFNISRDIVPISGSLIREKPLTYWNYINSFAKDYFTKKIAIIGTESTGKTVLSEQLAKYYNTTWCPELGRDIVTTSSETSLEDINKIAYEHAKHILRYTRQANKLLIVDTDLTITKSYSRFIHGEIPKFDPWIEKVNQFDLYIYLEPTAPYIDDGTRFSKIIRDKLAYHHLEMFGEQGIKVNSFDFDQTISIERAYEKRFLEIILFINKFISQF